MKGPRKSSAWSSHVRFSGASSAPAHREWYRAVADHFDAMANPAWMAKEVDALDRLLRRRGVESVVDVACGTFSIDLRLMRRGYEVVGRDVSPDMVRVGQRALRDARQDADLGVGDMRSLRLGRTFDAILCLGTAFNYLTEPKDVRNALRTFRALLRPGGVLVLDLTNFDAWIDDPTNARAELDRTERDGTRVAIFGFNEQSPAKTIHTARLLTVVQRGRTIDVRFDEAPLKVWSKKAITRSLRIYDLRPIEWWGDLAPNNPYRRKRSPRLVAIAVRT